MTPGYQNSQSSHGHDNSGGPTDKVGQPSVHALTHDFRVVGYQHYDDEQRRRQYPIDHCRSEKRGDRRNLQKVYEHADQCRSRDDDIKASRAPKFFIKAVFPVKSLTDRIGARRG